MMEHIWKLQEFCNTMARLDVDGYEYAYLKAIVLFSPGKTCGGHWRRVPTGVCRWPCTRACCPAVSRQSALPARAAACPHSYLT